MVTWRQVRELREQLRAAQTRFINAHSAMANAVVPTPEQWTELDAAAAEYKRIDQELADLGKQA